jgi:DNA-binding winged helix-turn-helix (wHTH) protein/TolB-like protein/Tfp pilus assembly protein PilF
MSSRFYEFGPFRIDTLNHILLRNGTTLPLKPKVFDTLLVLVENRGRVMDKDELLTRLWPDTIVEESNLTQNVYLLRKILGTELNGDVYIETMPKRGYRFVATVNEVDDADTEIIVEEHSRSHVIIEQTDESDVGSKLAVAEPWSQAKTLAAGPSENQSSTWKRPALAIAVCILGVVVGVALYFRTTNRSTPTAARAPVKSIAVLPFRTISSDPGDTELSFGMTETLNTRLSTLRQIEVRPPSSARKFASPEQDPVAAARELKVDAILESSIQRSGNRVRVTLRLINATDGSTLWAGQADQQVEEIFVLQDQVAEQVARALVPQLSRSDQDLLAKRYTQNPEAYRLYMNGRYHWNRVTIENWGKAKEYFHLAIEKDPNYALPYTGLADLYSSIVADAIVPKEESMPKARQAAMRALELDETLAEAHVSLARIKAYYDWDWSGAELELKRAVELDPNSSVAHHEYANYLSYMGRSDQAIAEALRSRDLDPLSQLANFNLAFALICGRRYDEAVAESRQVLGTFPQAHYWMGLAYLWDAKYEEAAVEFENRLKTSDSDILVKPNLAYAYAMSGRKAQARTLMAELTEHYKQRRVSPYFMAMIHAGLGEKDQAFILLEEAYREHSRPLGALKIVPVWDSLRSDPRFTDLLRRIRIE